MGIPMSYPGYAQSYPSYHVAPRSALSSPDTEDDLRDDLGGLGMTLGSHGDDWDDTGMTCVTTTALHKAYWLPCCLN